MKRLTTLVAVGTAMVLTVLTPLAVAAGPGDPLPVRISFQPGASAATLEGSLAAGEMTRYVLRARQGQTMWVTVNPISGSAILVIWGADGTVLISDHADATTWNGPLPATQDYYIDVKGSVDVPSTYTLQVVIPPRLTGQTVTVDERAAGGRIVLNAGDQLAVTLEGNPTTGYIWEIQDVDARILQPVGAWDFQPASDRMGAGGTETRQFVAITAGTTTLELVYHRPWERDAPPLKMIAISVTVR
jgi:inhibitor of cysteine peptidase